MKQKTGDSVFVSRPLLEETGMKKEEKSIMVRLSLLGAGTALLILWMAANPVGHGNSVRESAINIGETARTYAEMHYIHGKEQSCR